MKWRNSKERELIAQGGCREQTLPTKHNPNPDLSDPLPLKSNSAKSPTTHLEALAKTRMAFNEALWTLPPPSLQNIGKNAMQNEDLEAESDINEEEDDMDAEDEEEINVT